MPRVLSLEEAKKIATHMCEEYGLPAPQFSCEVTKRSYGDPLTILKASILVPANNWFGKPKFKHKVIIQIEEKLTAGYENVLSQLESELKYNLEVRAKKAEMWRGKYAMQEADEFLEKELRK